MTTSSALPFAQQGGFSQVRAFAGDVLFTEVCPRHNCMLVKEGVVDLYLVREESAPSSKYTAAVGCLRHRAPSGVAGAQAQCRRAQLLRAVRDRRRYAVRRHHREPRNAPRACWTRCRSACPRPPSDRAAPSNPPARAVGLCRVAEPGGHGRSGPARRHQRRRRAARQPSAGSWPVPQGHCWRGHRCRTRRHRPGALLGIPPPRPPPARAPARPALIRYEDEKGQGRQVVFAPR